MTTVPLNNVSIADDALHGIAAEFDSSDDILRAASKASREGFTRMDAYSPFPVEGLSELVGFHHTWLPQIVFAGGLAGAITGFGLQYIGMGLDYPYNIGGRPLFSWPAFIPITFELMVLFAAFTTVGCIVLLNGLPKPYHPIFNTPGFERTSQDRFFLCIETSDPKFDRQQTRQFLESLGARAVSEVAK